MALGELFRNSLEYARRDSVTIAVAATEEPDHIRLTVTDDGPGVDARDRAHIFDPFHSSRPEGVGMGLTLVQEILLEHNGRIELDTDHAPGARFVLSVPHFPRHLVSRLEEEGAA